MKAIIYLHLSACTWIKGPRYSRVWPSADGPNDMGALAHCAKGCEAHCDEFKPQLTWTSPMKRRSDANIYMLILLRTIQKIQLIPTSRNPRFLYRNERQSYRTQSLPTNPSSYHRGRRNQRKGESLNKRRVRSTLAKSSSRKFFTIRTNNQQPCTSIFNSLEASKHMSPCLPVGPPFIKSQQHFPGLR